MPDLMSNYFFVSKVKLIPTLISSLCSQIGENQVGALLTFCPDSLCVDVNVFF